MPPEILSCRHGTRDSRSPPPSPAVRPGAHGLVVPSLALGRGLKAKRGSRDTPSSPSPPTLRPAERSPLGIPASPWGQRVGLVLSGSRKGHPLWTFLGRLRVCFVLCSRIPALGIRVDPPKGPKSVVGVGAGAGAQARQRPNGVHKFSLSCKVEE